MPKAPKASGPSAAEMEMQALQLEQLKKSKAQADADTATEKARSEEQASAIASNRVGMRSLLSNDWAGFARGGDLAPR